MMLQIGIQTLQRIVIVAIFLSVPTWAEEMTDQQFLSRALQTYDANEPPPQTDSPSVTVLVQLFIHRFHPGDKDGKGNAYFTLRESWRDPRLAYEGLGMEQKFVSVAPQNNIWTPDTFIVNADAVKKTGGAGSPEVRMMRVEPDGTVKSSYRIEAELICPSSKKHRLFPLDRQTCGIEISSYSNPNTHMIYKWDEEGTDGHPIQTKEGLDAETYDFESLNATECNAKTTSGDYSCIRAALHFKREWLFFVTRYYVPTAIIVMISWLVFWLTPKHAIAARIGIGLFCTAAMLAFYGAISYMILPSRTSATALDIWSWICLAFIILSLLESVFAHVLRKSEHHHGHHYSYREDERALMDDSPKRKRDKRSRVLDAISSVLFPLAFIVFAVVYWVVYLLLEA